jgi:endo-1,4-beta-xylanase
MRATTLRSLFLLALLLATGSPAAASLLEKDGFDLYQPAAGDALESRPSTGDLVRLEVIRPCQPFYGIGLSQPVAPAFPEGRRLVLRFRARSATRNPVRAVIERQGAPWTSVAEIAPRLTPDWRDYRAAGTTRVAYPSNGLAVRFQFGHQTGDLELAAVTLEDTGPDLGWLAARAALEPAAVQERISRHRMGSLTVAVTGTGGRPVPGAAVHAVQTRHAFLFGANIFELKPGNTEPWQRAYQQRFTALFNYATLPFYWGAFEPKRGQPDYARLDRMIGWCATNGLAMKGHPLIWHEVWPDWAPREPDVAIPLLRNRVTDIVTRYRNTIRYWDVLNEANNAAAMAGQTGEGAWIARDGKAEVVAAALGWARQAARGADTPVTLLYNDFNTGEANRFLLEQLQARGSLPDAIGIQSHMHGGAWPLEDVWSTVERFAAFGRPVHFTEITVLSGALETNAPVPGAAWPSTPEAEAQQADYVAALYTLLFSHPSLQALTWWDFSDRGAWKGAPSGFLRQDMTPKPVYNRLLALIRGAWWSDVTGRTGTNGLFEARVFGGDYDVTVTDENGNTQTRRLSVPPGGAHAETVVIR